MKLINLTPHTITFVNSEGNLMRIVEPSGSVARVKATTVVTGSIDGIPITETEFGEVEGLPDTEPGSIFIVSAIVAKRVPEREDVYVPNESVRDDNGRIIGCKSLGRI